MCVCVCVCVCVCEVCAQPICPVCNALHVSRGLPKHSTVEHQSLLDSMSVRNDAYSNKAVCLRFNSSHISYWLAGSESSGISGLSGASHLSILHYITPWSTAGVIISTEDFGDDQPQRRLH